jgi:hypothetical protein
MKTMISLLVSALQQALGIHTEAKMKYSFQPLPSYWTMTPADKLMKGHTNIN